MGQCLASIHLCRVRVTRLDQLGNPVVGPNNVYVTDKPMALGVTPQVEEGKDEVLIGGCDCIVASYRGFDKLRYFDLEFDMAVMEPELFEMLLGGDLIFDDGDGQGMWWPNQVSCSDSPQPNVCLEGWSSTWEDDHQFAAKPYMHWIWPSTHWMIGAQNLANEFNQPKITGWSRGSSQWGLGIFGDLPEEAQPLGGFFFTDTIPEAICGYQSFPIT